MLCRNPYTHGMHAYPCGQCMPCRFNKRRMWTHRIILEALQHEVNAFVTLTYRDDALPMTKDGLPTLNPKHVQDWLKRFRMMIAPRKIRYYLVGEYGDETERPHYHVALFNYPQCMRGVSQFSKRGTCCDVCDGVQTTWGFGNVYLGTLEIHSAQYVAGYVTKKMTGENDARLKGRHPEFCRMSLRPGIGADAMHEVASQLLTFNLDTTQADVPSVLRHGSRTLPLGRYLRRKLREMIGKNPNAPIETIIASTAKVLPLYEASRSAAPGFKDFAFKGALIDEGSQRVRQIEARNKIYKRRKPL